MIFLPHTNTVILLEPYCGTITEPGLPVALIEGKILNWMFLNIYNPVVPTENWLRATHNQRQKKLSKSLQSYCSAIF